MAPQPAPPGGASSRARGLTKKVGPLPVWAWALAGLAVVAVLYLTRPKAATATQQAQQDQQPSTGEQLTTGSGTSDATIASLLDQNAQALNALLARILGGPTITPPPTGTIDPGNGYIGPADYLPTSGPTVSPGSPGSYLATAASSGIQFPGGMPALSGVVAANPALVTFGVDKIPTLATGFGAATVPSGPTGSQQRSVSGHGAVID